MPRLAQHNRNHSFPPCLKFTQRSSSNHLSPPTANIDDAPWAHFLSPVNDDDDPSDFLNFTAGIIATSDASAKKKQKPSKFRPSNAKKWDQGVVNFHHGTYQRRDEDHGFVENRQDPWSHIVEQDVMAATHPSDESRHARPRGRSKTRTLSGHRHSWREPSVDLFTVEEEAINNIFMEDQDDKDNTIAIFIDDYSEVVPRIKVFADDDLLPTKREPARDSMFSDDEVFTEFAAITQHDFTHSPQSTPSLRLSPTIRVDDDFIPELDIGEGYHAETSFWGSEERARL